MEEKCNFDLLVHLYKPVLASKKQHAGKKNAFWHLA